MLKILEIDILRCNVGDWTCLTIFFLLSFVVLKESWALFYQVPRKNPSRRHQLPPYRKRHFWNETRVAWLTYFSIWIFLFLLKNFPFKNVQKIKSDVMFLSVNSSSPKAIDKTKPGIILLLLIFNWIERSSPLNSLSTIYQNT